MWLTSSPPETGADTLAAMAKVTVAGPTLHVTPSPRCCLHVWVVGNPISGGKQGAAVLNRLEMLFCQSFGEDMVHTTSSSGFLQNLSCHPLPDSATSPVSAVNALWTAAAAAMPARPAGCSQSPPASSSSGAAVRTVIIRTDEKGHAKAVSDALSQRVLSSRLNTDRWRPSQGRRSPSTQHILLIVGGDGTLSEVTNGLCEGTLTWFAQRTASGSARTSAATTTTSDAHVEREAAVLSQLLPAVIYVPGGTGSDFSKLGLCCRTPEDALRVVRDGLAHQLFPVASGSCGDDRSHRDSEAWGAVASSLPLSQYGTSALSELPACSAHAVDVGRIEFLRTGTRHFFINECSAGMSCDVVQRGERFKRCRWISMLGGSLLFATSALVSLLFMAPKPLYICKLPPRVPLSATSTTPLDDYDTDSAAAESDASWVQMRREDDGNGESGGSSAGLCNRSAYTKPTSATSSSDAGSVPPRGGPNSLVALAPFLSLRTPLERLCAQLGWSVCTETEGPARGHDSCGPSHTLASTFTQGAKAASEAEKGSAAYAQHARASIPPPSATTVRCSLQTPPHQVLQLLDINRNELELHRLLQQPERYLTGVPVVSLSGDLAIPITSTKVTGDDISGKDAVSAASFDEDEEQYEYIRCKLNAQASSGDWTSEHLFRVSSEALGADTEAGTGVISASVRPHDVSDGSFSSLTWVELPSSMIAFANGRWYGGGMLVAPHANPTDGLLSCTNWVATILPFVAGVRSIYTGGHVHWRSTSAFDGARFLITSAPPSSASGAMVGPMDRLVNAPSGVEEELYMEADGEVLHAAPAIVELAGKITFLVPSTATVCLGNAAPGTTRERLAAQTPPRSCATVLPTPGRRFRWLHDELRRLLRQLTNGTSQCRGTGNR
ncbi:hypothetical protein LSCM1_06287 [Leishmania martiniquensis]|uniref:DAGKc domain-containing protein n=1 Tax=Leishmania martiniquensis TaxID=1580590 RepID=A0A836HPZ4_9TRYP|nr:hypothetical protein LSCM1_06287 [Leishmania martiniquensis]